ncbi:MAG: hypothetical protein KJ000_26500 [Pirellulaceae bacterium]|nr:hypothetical protein [Pirellulaceae bacterium]
MRFLTGSLAALLPGQSGSPRMTRRLVVEKLDPRQMLDGTGTAFASSFAEGESAPMADFTLTDFNATSPTYQQPVSPRDYLEQVSGWYLGSAF